MKHIRILGAGLLAALALTVVGVSAAQAASPTWGSCYRTPYGYGGKYKDAGCTETATKNSGGYQWAGLEPERKKHLEPMTAEGEIAFETPAGVRVACTGMSPEFESFSVALPGAALRTPSWTFGGCSSNGQPCNSFNQFAGDIKNEFAYAEEEGAGWRGKLGFVSGQGGASPVVGVQYSVKQKGELLFNQIDCESPLTEDVEIGALKGKATWTSTIGPVNTMTTEFTQVYSSSSAGVQAVQGFEGKKPAQLEMFVHGHWEPVAMTATFHLPYEGGGEAFEIESDQVALCRAVMVPRALHGSAGPGRRRTSVRQVKTGSRPRRRVVAETE